MRGTLLRPGIVALALALSLAGPARALGYEPFEPGASAERAQAALARITGSDASPLAPWTPMEAALASPAPPSVEAGSSWEPIPPPARWVHSTIYDPIRDRLVVYGGQGYAGSSNETWAFYLSGIPRWQRLSPSGATPSPRAFHTAIYDSLRDRMVVFGGVDGSGAPKNDVWVLNFAGNPTWSQIIAAGKPPAARQWHAAVYDRARDRMLVMGGSAGGTTFSDVWALSLSGTPAWTQLTPTGTAPSRMAQAAVYDRTNDRLVITCGIDASGAAKNDTWALTLGGTPAWSQIIPAGTPPSTRYGAGAMYDRVRGRLLLFAGGMGAPNTNETFELTLGATPTWTQLTPTNAPQGRQFHSVIYDPIGDRMLAYGGSSGAVLSDVWALPLSPTTNWTPLSGTRRKGHSALYDSARQRMIIFGGDSGGALNDAWELTLGANPTWAKLWPGGTPPSPRTYHSGIYEPLRDRMIVFGGRDASPNNEVWELTFSGEVAWRRILPGGTAPAPRLDHAAVYDPVGDRMIVFGGADAGGVFNDVWVLSLVGTPTWTQLVPSGSGPSGRGGAHVVYDSVRNRLIVHGGYDRLFNALGDAYALSLSGTPTWTKLTPSGTPPAPRLAGASIYDPARDRMVVVDGFDFTTYFSDTWALQFSGSTSSWLLQSFTGTTPATRADHRAVYDPTEDRLLFFGGQNPGGVLHDTWSLDFTNTVDVPIVAARASRVSLAPPSPNPARQGSAFSFELPSASDGVELSLYDLAGRRVATLARGTYGAGASRVVWDGKSDAGQRAPAGVYFARLLTSLGASSTKVVVSP